MRNYYNYSKLFLLLGVVAIALLIQGVIHLYREVETYGAERHYTTAHVTYGTQSKATAMPPMVQSPSLRHTAVAVPMASSRTSYTVRHTPSASSSMKIYTTSSAQVRSIGSGGSGGGGGIATTNGVGSSRRGMTYSGASVAMPTLALATPTYAATASMQEEYNGFGPKRIQANGDGSYNGETKEENGNTYYWDEENEEWINTTPIGTTKTENGITYEWNGSAWVKIAGTDPTLPVGATPWLLLLALAIVYAKRKRSVTI